MTRDTKLMSIDCVNALNGCWPQEVNWEDFEAQDKEIKDSTTEEWEKPEAFMINFANMPSLPHRLKVWSFSSQWSDEATLA